MMPDSVQAAARIPLLELDEERNAIRRWQDHGDQEALELLIRSHARQAWSMAVRYTDNPVHQEDLAAEGVLGLIRAADNFDLGQDVRFSTYAGWWVMNGVTSAATRIRSVIDVPVRAVTEMRSGKMAEEDQSVITMAMQGIVALDAPMGRHPVVHGRACQCRSDARGNSRGGIAAPGAAPADRIRHDRSER